VALKGEAKTKYMRDYMRRRRAGQPKRKAEAGSKTSVVRGRGREEPEKLALRAEIAQLKAMLREDPDAAKLRKKVVEQQAQLAGIRRAMKEIANERDRYRRRVLPKFRAATGLLTRENHNAIIKAFHSDRSKSVTATDLATAERLVTALRPLFDEG
jgi:hypothetical protein